MGLFGHEYVKSYTTQTTAVTPFYDVGDTLTGVVFQYQNTPSNFNNLIRSANENSIAGRMYIMAKQSAEGGKLADKLGVARGTIIGDYVPDSVLKTYITDADTIVSQQRDTIRPNIIARSILINQYNYRYELVDYRGTKNYEYLVTVDGIDYVFKECFLSQDYTIGMSYYTKRITGYYQGTAQYYYETFTKEIDSTVYNPKDEYLYVNYTDSDSNIHYWFYRLKDNTYPVINASIGKDTPVCYPTFVLRDNYNRIDKENPTLYKNTKKAIQRLNIPWENIVSQANADYSHMRSSERKKNEKNNKDYADNLGKIEEILLTFAVDITDNDQRVMQYLFWLFKHLHKIGTSNRVLEYNHDKLKQKFSWDSFSVTEVEGSKGKYHRYTCEGYEEQVPNPLYTSNTSYGSGYGYQSPYISQKVLEICYQHGKNHYTKIKIINPKASSYNNGTWNNCTCPQFSNLKSFDKIKDLNEYVKSVEDSENDNNDTHEFIVPIFPIIVRKYMGAIKGGELLSLGMRFVFHTYQKIKKKWYQTTWFTIIRIIIYIIIIIVVTYYTGGTGTATAMTLITMLELLLAYVLLKIVLKFICKVCKASDSLYTILDVILDCIFIYYSAGMCVSSSAAVGTASASTAAIPSYVLQSMAYSTYGATVGASVASSAIATASAIAVEISTAITVEAMTIMQTVRSLTNMCMTHDFSLDAIANSIGSMAFSMSNGYLADCGWLALSSNSTLHLALNPEFLDACASKDWTRMMSSSAPYLLEACSVSNLNGRPTTSIVEKPSLLGMGQDVYNAYMSQEQKELQEKTQQLAEATASLSRKSEIQSNLYNYIMNKGKSEINYILMKKMQYTDDYEYIKF